jgi:hypothetical protein
MEDISMKATAVELVLNHWPYGLELQPSADGLVLRPRRKARANWSKAFRPPLAKKDELHNTPGEERL